MSADDDKKAAALAAVSEVEDGMLVGLGTGSTAAHAIDALGARLREGLKIEAVATSLASAAQAERLGIRVHDFADVAQVDLTIDGADEVDPRLYAIKGAGGAMVREKIVASASRRMVVIADGSKRVAAIGGCKLPVELLPFARAYVERALVELGATPTLRMAGDRPYLTDNGNLVFDCHVADWRNPPALDRALNDLPGVVGHGLFLREISASYIANHGQVTRIDRNDQV